MHWCHYVQCIRLLNIAKSVISWRTLGDIFKCLPSPHVLRSRVLGKKSSNYFHSLEGSWKRWFVHSKESVFWFSTLMLQVRSHYVATTVHLYDILSWGNFWHHDVIISKLITSTIYCYDIVKLHCDLYVGVFSKVTHQEILGGNACTPAQNCWACRVTIKM